ncbi:hypothetical protein BDN71DRAFT_858695 [Pleurotus eryngii]|uniref:Secreted protein n=1 Tax=Pleurotus eryngii TaxID=5323 RepID=A0A9P5ZX39_PLEER|nr:hypothetical protein BDN71DRAFT_858695 [Pleurotus eryngii]
MLHLFIHDAAFIIIILFPRYPVSLALPPTATDLQRLGSSSNIHESHCRQHVLTVCKSRRIINPSLPELHSSRLFCN